MRVASWYHSYRSVHKSVASYSSCLLWCRLILPTTYPFICLLCMAVMPPLPAALVLSLPSFLPLHLHFYMHNFTEYFNVVWIPTMTVHVSLISLCRCHCWHCALLTVTLNHYTMLLLTIANGMQCTPSLTPLLTDDAFNPLTTNLQSAVHND